MQSPTSQIVDEAINDLEEPAAVDDKQPKGGADDKPADPKKPDAKDDGTGADKPKDDPKKPADGEVAKPKYDKDGKRLEEPAKDDKVDKPKEGEFTADDALEVDAPAAPQTPTDAAGIQLSPQEQKHIADNIGEPIIIRGMQGEGDAAKVVEIKAYSPNDIPTDFKFANDKELAAAGAGFQNLEQKANRLLGEFRQHQSNTAAQDFEQRENEGIRTDVADLQKEGRFPKFTVQPGATGFDDSPEAKTMAEVLQVMTDKNKTFLDQYNQGRPYKHIGFVEAFDIWERSNPDRKAAAKADDDQAAEDKARKANGTERGDSNRGMNPSNIMKPTVKPGTTTRDLLNRIDNDDF